MEWMLLRSIMLVIRNSSDKSIQNLFKKSIRLTLLELKSISKLSNKMKRTYNRIQRKRDRIDGRFDQLLGSLEMHRNVLLKDKIDTLWSNENKKHYLSLRLGIEKKKAQRAKLNEKLKETYKMMLNFVYKRKESQKIMPLETEGKFLDSLRLVCESGWVLNSKDFYQILNIIQV